MRSFEIPGVGGIGLYPLTNDHQEYFGNDGLAKLYSDTESCYSEACLLMNLSSQEAMAMRNNARRLSLEKGYDYLSRTKQFLAGVNEIVK